MPHRLHLISGHSKILIISFSSIGLFWNFILILSLYLDFKEVLATEKVYKSTIGYESASCHSEYLCKKKLNPFCHGGGVKLTHTFFEHLLRPNGHVKVAEFFWLFLSIRWLKIWQKKFEFFKGGIPPLAPQRGRPAQKWPPTTAYDPIFLMQNLFIPQKWGCKQKTRP